MHELACVFLSTVKHFDLVWFSFEDEKINLFLFLLYVTFHKHLELSQVLELIINSFFWDEFSYYRASDSSISDMQFSSDPDDDIYYGPR